VATIVRIALLSAAKSIHSIRWANALAQRGHKVALFSLYKHKTDGSVFLPEVELHYIYGCGVLGYRTGSNQLKKALAEFKPDILNAHYATGYGTLARRSKFCPLLLSVWGSDVYDFPYKSFIHKRIIQRNLESANCIASTSKSMAKQVNKIYPTNSAKKKIFITPFGVDCDKFKRLSSPPQNKLTIGIVKALEPKYGIEYLLRAFAILKARLEDEDKMPSDGIKLLIYGSGSQLKMLEHLSRKLNIADCTHFCGAIPNAQVPQAINEFNIFCAPSTLDSESFGVAAVEAMACETPVIVSDADGLQEVTLDNVTGFVVPKCDYITLADKLYCLSVNPQLCNKMGRAGRQHVLENYDWKNNVLTMEEALMQTLTLFKQTQKNEAGLNL
jgi:glycosyltransferase involved in cell wall biosynthesis